MQTEQWMKEYVNLNQARGPVAQQYAWRDLYSHLERNFTVEQVIGYCQAMIRSEKHERRHFAQLATTKRYITLQIKVYEEFITIAE